MEKLSYYARRKPPPEYEREVGEGVGGLRRTVTALSRVLSVVEAGLIIGEALDKLYDRRADIQKCLLKAIDGRQDVNPEVDKAGEEIAACIGQVVGMRRRPTRTRTRIRMRAAG